MPPSPDQPIALAAVQVPGLRVAFVALAPAEAMFHPAAMPAPTPLDEQHPHPLPTHLPVGLTPRRLGEAYCAVDASGAFQVTWIELPLPPDATLSLPWNSDDGPVPALQGFQFKGREAVAIAASWSMVSTERLPLIVTRADPDTCWVVGGRLPIEALARVAVSLPGGV